MFDLIRQVKEFARPEEVSVDNVVFRLHSRVTVLMLLLSTTIVGIKSYFGEPISCISNGNQPISTGALNTYCWVANTFTVTHHLRGVPGRDNAGPGLGPSEEEGIIDQRYYKWVSFVLVIQALVFSTPRALWGIWERNTVKLLSKDLYTPITDEIWTPQRKAQLIGYFLNINANSHNFYAIRFLICEVMNLLISVSQIFLLNFFFEGQFFSYGLATVAFATSPVEKEMPNPMTQLFPLGGKCKIFYYGPSGTVQLLDALCVLPLNIFNEKIFIFFWFWYIFLTFAGMLAVIYRLIVFTFPCARLYLMRAQTRLLLKKNLDNAVAALHFGDWFLLYQLAENVNPIVYRELINEIGAAVSSKHFESLA